MCIKAYCTTVHGASDDNSKRNIPVSEMFSKCEMQRLTKCMHQHEICLFCTFARFLEQFRIHLNEQKRAKTAR